MLLELLSFGGSSVIILNLCSVSISSVHTSSDECWQQGFHALEALRFNFRFDSPLASHHIIFQVPRCLTLITVLCLIQFVDNSAFTPHSVHRSNSFIYVLSQVLGWMIKKVKEAVGMEVHLYCWLLIDSFYERNIVNRFSNNFFFANFCRCTLELEGTKKVSCIAKLLVGIVHLRLYTSSRIIFFMLSKHQFWHRHVCCIGR